MPQAEPDEPFDRSLYESPRPTPVDEVIAIPPTWTRLGEGEIWIDRQQKLVGVGGHICLRAGVLEMFACLNRTKEHESVVAVHVPAQQVHAALLAVGAKPGQPVQWYPEYRPASGTPVKIDVRWRSDGEEKTLAAQAMVRDIQSKEPLALDWVFAGSQMWTHPDTGQEHYLAESGELICVSNFGSATMDLPVASTADAGNLLFEALTENIPELNTPVLLILRPQVEGPRP